MRVTPAVAPAALIAVKHLWRCLTASTCTDMWFTPASIYCWNESSAFSIMRCASKVGPSPSAFRNLAITGGPNVKFGTKLPSIMSKWSQSNPASTASLHAFPKSARSAVRTDGAIIINTLSNHANRCQDMSIGVYKPS